MSMTTALLRKVEMLERAGKLKRARRHTKDLYGEAGFALTC